MKSGWDKLQLAFIIGFFVLSGFGVAGDYIIGEQDTAVEMPAEGAIYLGAGECELCHREIYEEWNSSGHKYMLMTPDEALEIRPDLPLPEGHEKEDILYFIGGWGWKVRYIDRQGYIITKTGEESQINGSNQFNLETEEWVDYHAGENFEYACFSCHNTGSSLKKKDNLPGINGSWEFRGIQCEACHGPGSVHVAQGGGEDTAITVDRTAFACGQCHRRGPDDGKIPASGGFVNHHEQYQELLASNMSGLSCIACHNPHSPVHDGATFRPESSGIIRDCADCHPQAAEIYEASVMGKAGVECVDCHMPENVRSAVSSGPYVGDVRSHIFMINNSAEAEFTYVDPDDGKEYARPYITLEYACLPCHKTENKEWATQNTQTAIKHYAGGDEATETEKPTEPPAEKTPGYGIFLAVVVLFGTRRFKKN